MALFDFFLFLFFQLLQSLFGIDLGSFDLGIIGL